MSLIAGWSRGTWSEGAWSSPLPVEVTGVSATGAVDSVSVIATANVPTTGLSSSGQVGSVSIVTGSVTTVTGVEASVITGRSSNTFTAYSNAQLSTTRSKFGVSSLRTDGTFDRVQPDTTNAWGSADYTVEFWIYFTSIPSGNQFLFDNRTSSNSGNLIYLDLNGRVGAVIDGGTSGSASPVSVATNTWHHLALVREGSTFRFFVNGVASSNNFASNTTDYGNRDYTVGSGYFSTPGAFGFNGWLDEFRASDTARYTSNFTPPTSAFGPDDFAQALLHFDGTNGSTTITNSALLGAITVTGGASTSTTGVAGTGEVGDAVVSLNQIVYPTGVSTTGEIGSVTVNEGSGVVVTLTGVSGTGEVGTAIASIPAVVPVTGLSATGAVGAVSVALIIHVPVTGLPATASVGSVVARAGAKAYVTGVAATGQVGNALVWGRIVPNPGSTWTEVEPSGITTWTEIAA